MNAILLLALAWPSSAQLESAVSRAKPLVKQARAVQAPDDYTGEPGDVTEEEARRPPKKVSDQVWRSSRLDEVGLEQLYPLGIRTILNLEGPSEYRDELARLARVERKFPGKHIESLNVPMSGIMRPKFSQIDAALAVLADFNRAPILVHCKHGEDRTGVVVAEYRYEVEKKMSLEEAVAEAKSFNCCHLVLIGENGLRDFMLAYRERRN